MEWSDLITQEEEITQENVSVASKSIYQSRLNSYEKTLDKLNQPPFPITSEKIQGFLIDKKNNGCTYNTLIAYICAFNYYFRQNDLDILTNSIEFKNFKNGLRRTMKGDTCPKAKQPFDIQWFKLYLEKFDMNTFQDYLFYFYMCLSFSAFLRISELENLKKSDFKLSEDKKVLTINIQSSKTDQFGRGALTYIYKNESIWCPINYISILDQFEKDDDKIMIYSIQALRSHLQVVLKAIGIQDPQNYSWHSFRRGGAYLCGMHQVPDSIIKAHGRWRSSAYIRYVSVDMSHAGERIADTFGSI